MAATALRFRRFPGRNGARVSSDPGVSADRHRAGRGDGGGILHHQPEEPGRREGLPLRMRLRAVRGRAHQVRRAVLPGLDPVHHLRPGSRLPVPVGSRAR
ncbi:hypothetical protein Lal_00005242 [Lupinus albus]|nr:hypothetical protein Lal_00005242 [Lupinus albus]